MRPAGGCEVIVVPHTHWDREWYLSCEEFRFYLVEALDRVLELLESDPDYRFTLDGQVIPLLDYLEVRPEKEGLVKEHIRSGRLLVGPWYIQPDEFLPSGEALIRNLLLGTRIARGFGGVMLEGYVPDSFGHIAQLPQILRGFGIKTAFLMRGADLVEGGEFVWQAPDGSEVFTHVFEAGYCVGAFLKGGAADPPPALAELLGRGLLPPGLPPLVGLLHFLRERSSTGAVLLPSGCDHLGPQEDLPQALKGLAEEVPGFRFLLGTLTDYSHRLSQAGPKLPRAMGELRTGGKRHFILSGVYSTRLPLKQRNCALEVLLERYVEPLCAFAHLLGHDLTPFVHAAWKLVLQNQAHDSICGTGVDRVHREMLVRYDRAEAIAHQAVRAALTAIGAQLGAPGEGVPILLYNPCPWRRREEAVVEVDPELEGHGLMDPTGRAVPSAVVGEKLVSEGILTGVKHVRKKLLAFQADLPPFGVKLYELSPGKVEDREPGSPVVNERTLENEFYRVEMAQDGTFSVLDKETGRLLRGLGFLEDSGDAGDEYNYSPPERQGIITSHGTRACLRVAQALPWKGTIRADLLLRLPKALAEDRRARSPEQVDCPVTLLVSLQRGVKRVDLAIEVENRARDHRLRVGFPTGLSARHSIAEDAFWVVRRPVQPPDGAGWLEQPATTHPQKGFVALEDGEGGVAVLNRGLPEYEVTEGGTIYVTLLRCVGWLSRDDLSTRKGHAGPPYEAPEAQCLGRHRFELALYTYRGTWEEARLWEQAHAFRAPPIGVQLKGPPQGTLPPEMGLLQLQPGLALSTLKMAEEGDGVIVRLYNPTSRPISGALRTAWGLVKAQTVRLDETPQGIIPLKAPDEVPVTLHGGEIKTIKLLFSYLHLHGHKAREELGVKIR